jgi:hypothetical protein
MANTSMRRFFSKLVRFTKANLTFAILSTVLTALYLALFVFQARVDVNLQIDAPHSSY